MKLSETGFSFEKKWGCGEENPVFIDKGEGGEEGIKIHDLLSSLKILPSMAGILLVTFYTSDSLSLISSVKIFTLNIE